MKFYIIIFIFILCGASLVTSFSWQSCGNQTDPMKIISADVYFNKTKILYVTGRGKSAITATSPIQGEILIQRKFFWGWTTIPCVQNLGSCNFDDICELSSYTNTSCPTDYVVNNIPCTCPIRQGQYAVKRFPINLEMLPNWSEEGTYRIKVRLFKDNQELFCSIFIIIF